MKTSRTAFMLFLVALSLNLQGQVRPGTSLDKIDKWTKKDLIQPAELASMLNDPQARKPLIYNIGVAGNIPTAKKIGAASEAENLDAFRRTLHGLPKDSFMVIYCGCCPFARCPNIRPAFDLMKSMGFVRGRLLNIPVNLKTDWIGKGYPMATE